MDSSLVRAISTSFPHHDFRFIKCNTKVVSLLDHWEERKVGKEGEEPGEGGQRKKRKRRKRTEEERRKMRRTKRRRKKERKKRVRGGGGKEEEEDQWYYTTVFYSSCLFSMGLCIRSEISNNNQLCLFIDYICLLIQLLTIYNFPFYTSSQHIWLAL